MMVKTAFDLYHLEFRVYRHQLSELWDHVVDEMKVSDGDLITFHDLKPEDFTEGMMEEVKDLHISLTVDFSSQIADGYVCPKLTAAKRLVNMNRFYSMLAYYDQELLNKGESGCAVVIEIGCPAK